MSEWIAVARGSLAAAREYSESVREAVAGVVAPDGVVDAALLTREQHRVHGFAWIAASIAALEATLDWAVRAQGAGGISYNGIPYPEVWPPVIAYLV